MMVLIVVTSSHCSEVWSNLCTPLGKSFIAIDGLIIVCLLRSSVHIVLLWFQNNADSLTK